MLYLAVAVAGGIGALLRFFAVRFVTAEIDGSFPYGTLTVNILGSFAMGFLAWMFLHKWQIDVVLRNAVLVGLLGGFTTFSSFSLDTLYLLEQQAWLKASLYMLTSVLCCVVMCFAGMALARQLS